MAQFHIIRDRKRCAAMQTGASPKAAYIGPLPTDNTNRHIHQPPLTTPKPVPPSGPEQNTNVNRYIPQTPPTTARPTPPKEPPSEEILEKNRRQVMEQQPTPTNVEPIIQDNNPYNVPTHVRGVATEWGKAVGNSIARIMK